MELFANNYRFFLIGIYIGRYSDYYFEYIGVWIDIIWYVEYIHLYTMKNINNWLNFQLLIIIDFFYVK